MIDTIEKMNIIDTYLKFMWNKWTPEENKRFCAYMQDEYLANHMWNKWIHCIEVAGSIGAPAMFWSEICNNTQGELVNYITYRITNG